MIPQFQTIQDCLRYLGGVSRPCDIMPPKVEATSTTPLKVFDAAEYQGRELLKLSLQNVHTVAIFYTIDQDANCSATNFHGILNAGTATKDGLGGFVDITPLKPKRNVYVYSASAGIVAVVKAFVAIR